MTSREIIGHQLVDSCGVNFANIGKIERGAYNVSIDILGRVCEALGADIKIIERG